MIRPILLCLLFISEGYSAYRGDLSWLYFKPSKNLQMGHTFDFDRKSQKPIHFGPDWFHGLRGVINYEDLNVDINVYYSFYITKGEKKWEGSATPNPFIKGQEIGQIIGKHTFPLPAAIITTMDGHLLLRIQESGITFGYPFRWERLCLKPFIGIKALLLEQKFYSFLESVFINTETLITESNIIHAFNEIKGAGLGAGCYGEYSLVWGFSTFASLDLSTVYGQRSLLQKKFHNQIVDEVGDHNNLVKGWKPSGFTPFLTTSVGLLYKKGFLLFRLAWENHFYSTLNLIRGHRETLYTYGLALTGAIQF